MENEGRLRAVAQSAFIDSPLDNSGPYDALSGDTEVDKASAIIVGSETVFINILEKEQGGIKYTFSMNVTGVNPQNPSGGACGLPDTYVL